MSPLVTRPSLPEPGTAAASIPLSAASLRTEGASGTSEPADFAVAGAGADAGTAAAFSAAGAGAFALGAPAPSLICPSKAPTATVSPSLAAISPSTPAAGAGTSIVTLSVSSSTSGSSTATGSPGFLNHLPMVASVTDSPSVGTRMSVMLLPQRLVQQRLELLEVQRHRADGSSGRGGAAGIARPLVLGAELLEHPFEVGLQERERAHVARLLLAPHEFRLLETAELLHQRLERHRIELLDAQQVDVVDAAFLALLVEVVVDLARAHHHAADLVVGGELDLLVRKQLGVVPKQPMERGVG